MKASHVAIESMREHLDAVYDVTVAYEGTLTADGKRRSAPSMPGTVTHMTCCFFFFFSFKPKKSDTCRIAQMMNNSGAG